MNCQEFWNTLPEIGASHPHLEQCAGCAARQRRRRELAAGMRELASSMAHTGAPARVEARLLAAFHAHAGTSLAMPSRRRWIPAATWAAAFAAMLAIGIFVVRDRSQEAKRPTPPRNIEMALLDTPSAALETALEEGYLPLPGAAELAPTEDVNVLHVELPRSAMMQVGIEVSPERADETVLADVMVGSDGLARAVRFVNAGSDD